MKDRIATIIVLYNSLISDSKAFETLKNDNLDIFFLDNSTDQSCIDKNVELSKTMNCKYYNMGGNIGLSKAYNFIIDELKNNYDYNYMLLSDDDTLYTEEFQNLLVEEVKKNRYQVILPTIVDSLDGVVASPIKLTGIPLVRYKEGSKNPPKRIEGINSGTCVRLDAFDNWHYNENIFLYFVDTDFFQNNVNKNKLSYTILPCVIKQNFSSSEEFNDNSIKRLEMVLDDAKRFFATSKIKPIKMVVYKITLIHRLYSQHHDKRLFKLFWY